MKKTITTLLVFLGLVGTAYAAGIPITVPSAPGANYVLLSNPNGTYGYVATSSLGIIGGGGSGTSTNYWLFLGNNLFPATSTSYVTADHFVATGTATTTLLNASSTSFFANTLSLGASAISYIQGLFSATTPIVDTTGVISCPTCVTNQYASSTFPTFTYASSTYYLASNPNGYTSNAGTVTSITATSPLTGGTISTSGSIGCQTASGSQAGCLASADWTTFNNKLSNLLGGLNAILGNSTTTNATTTSLAITGLSNTILAVNANGTVIATTTSSGTNYFSNSGATTTLTTGSTLQVGNIVATTTATSSFGGAIVGTGSIAGSLVLNNPAGTATTTITTATSSFSGAVQVPILQALSKTAASSFANPILTLGSSTDTTGNLNGFTFGTSSIDVEGSNVVIPSITGNSVPIFGATTAGVNGTLIMFAPSSGYPQTNFVDNTTGNEAVVGYSPTSPDNLILDNLAATGSINFYTNGTQNATLLSNGNFGISTSSPVTKLAVVGGAILNAEVVDATSSATILSLASSSAQMAPIGTGTTTFNIKSVVPGAVLRENVCNPPNAPSASFSFISSSTIYWGSDTTATGTPKAIVTATGTCQLWIFSASQMASGTPIIWGQ